MHCSISSLFKFKKSKMKLLLLVVLALCYVSQIESQFSANCDLFSRFRGSCGPRTIPPATTQSTTTRRSVTTRRQIRTKPPTTKPRTTRRTTRPTTPTTTVVTSNEKTCNGKARIWKLCKGVPPMRTTDDTCTEITEPCKTGALLASLVMENFLGPSTQGGSGSSGGGGGGGGGIRGRNLVINSARAEAESNNTDNCYSITDANGNVIAGNCNQAGSGGNNRRKRSVIKQTKRDLLIMMDESGSVGRARFGKVKRIAAAIVRLLCAQIKVRPDLTRVAVMSFDRRIHFHIPLRSYLGSDQELLAKYIVRRIIYNRRTAGSTCLNNALDYAFHTALRIGGRRDQADVEQDIIIITDGCANCITNHKTPKQAIKAATERFIANGIHVYVIGIGLNRNCKDLLRILAQGGRCYHFFYLDQWDFDVKAFLEQLENPPGNVCLDVFESPTQQCLAPIGK